MVHEDFVVAVAALFQRFHLAYHADEEAKVKTRNGCQLAQDHTANQWMNWNSLPCFLTPRLTLLPVTRANTAFIILRSTALLMRYSTEGISVVPPGTWNKISTSVVRIQNSLLFSQPSFPPNFPPHTPPLYPPLLNSSGWLSFQYLSPNSVSH